jgi:choline dehydrogenase-like flavoprotein
MISQWYVTPIQSPDWESHIGSIVGAYHSSGRTDGKINIETAFTSFPMQIAPGMIGQAMISMSVLTKPLSFGDLTLREKDWSAPLKVKYGLMKNPLDLPPLVDAFKKSREAMLTSGIPYLTEITPGFAVVPAGASDAQIGAWILSKVITDYHTVASTPMGLCSEGSTVDENLKVCGISGLRIADNGVFPYPYTAHTTDTGARLIGEQAAFLIRGYY